MSEAQEGTIDPVTQPISLAADLFKGQTVIVSGGGSGIGRATAWIAARLGAAVVVCGRTEEKLVGVVEAMRAEGLDADFEVVDIRERASARRAIDNIWNRFEHVDLLVNSAGGQFPKAAIDYSENGWNAVINTNLNGTWHMMQAAAQHWRDTRRPGSIVNIVVVGRGLFGVAHTRAARAGVIALSEAVSVEWGPYKIRVNCIGPGAVRTEGWAVYDEKTRNKYALTNPLMRVASAWEIAEAALFVGGPAGGFINGELLNVDGAGRHWGEIWTTGKPNYFAEATRAWDADALPE
ncbi:MAG: SDR family oxidoreductase [Gammaproteobacteria bacterium]|nr:SDR family oxidoreductase [Gammaproteobacteria bacterium]MBI5616214.1 SDR family oxidoreductase [Gammaproteobacteria bacterium]